MSRYRPFGLAAAALVAWAAAHGAARQPGPPGPPPGARPEAPPPEPYTAFPEIKPPPPGPNGQPPPVGEGPPVRPPAADDTPLRKVRRAQVQEGAAALARAEQRFAFGQYTPAEYAAYVRLSGEVFRVAAELADAPAERVRLYEERVRRLKQVEATVTARVQAGTEPPDRLHEARFHRLQAEAELLQAMEPPAAEPAGVPLYPAPVPVFCPPTGPTRGGILRRR